MIKKDIRVLVVCGGISTEREVSLRSGKSIYEALLRLGYTNAEFFDMTRYNIPDIINKRPDIVFLGLHGKGGEDGCMQGMLELAGIPYTGPGVATSAICMNKIYTKQLLCSMGLPTPEFMVLRKDECGDLSAVIDLLICKFGLPMVLKSPCQGSSFGVVIVKKKEEIPGAIDDVFKFGDHLLAEEFIKGMELTLPILGNDELEIYPIVEITSEREFCDYTAKTTLGLCTHIIPASIDKATEKRIVELGQKVYKALNCCGLSRVDFIVDIKKGPMIIEVNTLPGMTDMSLFPDSARYAGLSYDELVERILIQGINTKRDFC